MEELRRSTGVRRFRSWRADQPIATIVVVHGFGEHSGLYERFGARATAAGVSVHALDLAGHGASDGPRGTVTSMEDLIADVEALVDHVDDGTPISILGHCLGSVVATLLVARAPARYRSLVVVGPAVVPDLLLRALVDADDDAALAAVPDPSALSTDPWYVERCTTDPLVWEVGFPAPTLAELARAWAAIDAAGPRLQLPVLAVLGGKDYFMQPDTLRAWVEGLPDGALSVVPGSLHAVLNDRDHAMVADTIVGFVVPPPVVVGPRREPEAEPARPPDLVLIMTDEQRFDWVGHAGDGTFETPALDRLAAHGVIFENGCSAATTCVPARTSLLTGLHFPTVPRAEGRFALREGFWTVARELRDAGYETALIGRMHFAPIHADHGFETMRMCENINPGSGYTDADEDDYQRFLAEQGRPDWRVLSPDPGGGAPRPFDVALPRTFPDDGSYHSTSWIERETTAFLRHRDTSRPLFLIVSFPHPHAPYDPPEPYASMFDPADTVLPRDGYEATAALHGRFRADLDAPWTHRVAESGGTDRLRAVLTAIRGLVRQIDDSVGRIVDQLDLDSSVVFFTSDHGDYGGNRGLFTKVPWIPYDDLLRVPLVVAGGAVGRSGSRSPVLAQSASFAATCLDYAGIPVADDGFDFPSLRPLLDGDDTAVGTDGAPLAERPLISFSYSYPTIRDGRFKLITTENADDLLLFDLQDDPRELVDRSTDPGCATALAELHERLRFEARTPRKDRHPVDAERSRRQGMASAG